MDVDIDDIMFCFKLKGRCEILRRENGSTYIYVYDYNNLFCYQAWDIRTYNANGMRRRRTFTMPMSQYVNATKMYNLNHPYNRYTPSLILNTEQGGCVALTVESMNIEADDDNREMLVIKVLQNFESQWTNTTLKVTPTHNSVTVENTLAQVSKNTRSINQMYELMFTEFRFKHLNYNDFLTSTGVPFPTKLQTYGGRHFGALLAPWGDKPYINFNYLFEDRCTIRLRDTGDYHCIVIRVENPRNFCAYQGWSEHTSPQNQKLTRELRSIMPGSFVSQVNGYENLVKRYGLPVHDYAFKPTCIMKFPEFESHKNEDFVGVIMDFKMLHSLNGDITNTTSVLEMNVSLKYMDVRASNQQYFPVNLLKGEHKIFMNIDATTLTDAKAPPTPESICNGGSSADAAPSTTTNPATLTPAQQIRLNCIIEQTLTIASSGTPGAQAEANAVFEQELNKYGLQSLINPADSGTVPPPKKGPTVPGTGGGSGSGSGDKSQQKPEESLWYTLQHGTPTQVGMSVFQVYMTVQLMIAIPHMAMKVLAKGWSWYKTEGQFSKDVQSAKDFFKRKKAAANESGETTNADAVKEGTQACKADIQSSVNVKNADGLENWTTKGEYVSQKGQAAADQWALDNPEKNKCITGEVECTEEEQQAAEKEMTEARETAEADAEKSYEGPNGTTGKEIDSDFTKGLNRSVKTQQATGDNLLDVSQGNQQLNGENAGVNTEITERQEVAQNRLDDLEKANENAAEGGTCPASSVQMLVRGECGGDGGTGGEDGGDGAAGEEGDGADLEGTTGDLIGGELPAEDIGLLFL